MIIVSFIFLYFRFIFSNLCLCLVTRWLEFKSLHRGPCYECEQFMSHLTLCTLTADSLSTFCLVLHCVWNCRNRALYLMQTLISLIFYTIFYPPGLVPISSAKSSLSHFLTEPLKFNQLKTYLHVSNMLYIYP